MGMTSWARWRGDSTVGDGPILRPVGFARRWRSCLAPNAAPTVRLRSDWSACPSASLGPLPSCRGGARCAPWRPPAGPRPGTGAPWSRRVRAGGRRPVDRFSGPGRGPLLALRIVLSRLLRPALLAVLAVGLAALTYPGTDLAALAVPPTPVSVAKCVTPAVLRVSPPSSALPYIADPEGRRVILRGAVSGGLVDYWSGVDNRSLYPPPFHPTDPAAYQGGRCPANSAMVWQPPLCRNDLSEMSALAFDVLRPALSWSFRDPHPGRSNRQYLDR